MSLIRHSKAPSFKVSHSAGYLCSFQGHRRWEYGWHGVCQVCYMKGKGCYGSKDQFSSVQLLSHVWLFATPWTVAHHGSLSITNSWWCHPTISSSVVPCSSWLKSCPASGSFAMSQFFASGGWSIGALASASVLPMNIQGWFPLGLTGLISLQSKGRKQTHANHTNQSQRGC